MGPLSKSTSMSLKKGSHGQTTNPRGHRDNGRGNTYAAPVPQNRLESTNTSENRRTTAWHMPRTRVPKAHRLLRPQATVQYFQLPRQDLSISVYMGSSETIIWKFKVESDAACLGGLMARLSPLGRGKRGFASPRVGCFLRSICFLPWKSRRRG